MASRAETLLRELDAVARRFGEGEGEGARKVELLQGLKRCRLAKAGDVLRLHDILCFLRALPDDGDVLSTAEEMLASFHERSDLRKHRSELEGSGIAGTDVRFTFFAAMARWLAEGWGQNLSIDWEAFEKKELLAERLYLLGLDAETPGLDHRKLTARGWIDRFKGPQETDAEFLIRCIGAQRWDATVRDVLYDELELPLVFRTGPETPSRTSARLSGGRVAFQTEPWRKPRPDIRAEARRPPRSIRSVDRRTGQEIVDLARGAMMTRARDLDAFAGGDPDDVRIVDCGGGLEFALIGSKPEWRMMLECVYGWMMFQNRVPIGYVLSSAFLRSSEIAFNVFDTWRGGDAAHIYGRVLATTRAVFGTETFTIYPYQLGYGNPEGLESGSWWFYQKLGFRARDPKVLALMERELGRIRERVGYRSSPETLEKLARHNVYLELGRHRKSVIGTFRFDRVGLAVTDSIAERFGHRRVHAERVLADEVASELGVRAWRSFPAAERKAWMHWAPLVAILPGLDRWSAAERRALVRVIRAKGGRRESDYLRLFDAHPKLTRSILRLSEKPARGE
ncbi:MAG TPA: hypothetical protein ENJ09_00085 [Planctomycetes bacterium]|nr:hypothetical protein [Planctomycetota bacterium]